MKAMIFAAGLGTRLRPLTDDRPKALVEINGVTLLERVIKRIIEVGFNDITVNVHHFGDKVIRFLNERHFDAEIHVSDERDMLLDTGGGVLHARQWLDGDEPFLVHNADILTDLDLRAFYRSHVKSGAVASVLVKSRTTQRYFLFDDAMRLKGWTNKTTGETRPSGLSTEGLREYAFGGIHVMSPAIFPLLEQQAMENRVFSTTPFYINFCGEHVFNGYVPAADYRWLDVGKLDAIPQAEAMFP